MEFKPSLPSRKSQEADAGSSMKSASEHPALILLGPDKGKRYLELTNKPHNLFTNEDVREYVMLGSELRAAFRANEQIDANKVPDVITIESPIKVFTETDIEEWKTCAKRFSEFFEVVNAKELREQFEAIFSPSDVNALKAIFLKEKPVMTTDAIPDSYLAPLYGVLKSFGIDAVPNYFYDKEQVKDTIEKHENIFKKFGSTDPEEVMRILSERKVETNHLIIGILLGFPAESAEKFTPTPHTAKQGGIKAINIYGIRWADYGESSLQSKIKQQRLKSAFELSGILNIN
ncbi:MAG TPA: hypothetical protein VK675_04760 [Candidatus Paceibacterota bacterium]|nr:hypothetical protein [Candidatus Paceibacterota bacterium]